MDIERRMREELQGDKIGSLNRDLKAAQREISQLKQQIAQIAFVFP